jgi:hypothetical protein
VSELNADLFTTDQRIALGYAVCEARRSVCEAAVRADRWRDHPQLADAYAKQFTYAERRLAAMESIHDAANTWPARTWGWEVES